MTLAASVSAASVRSRASRAGRSPSARSVADWRSASSFGRFSPACSASQSATGALQAAQAGNQLLALQSQQLADLTALLAAQGRAQALDSARNAAVEAESRERLRRFLTRSTRYQPGNARMFHD